MNGKINELTQEYAKLYLNANKAKRKKIIDHIIAHLNGNSHDRKIRNNIRRKIHYYIDQSSSEEENEIQDVNHSSNISENINMIYIKEEKKFQEKRLHL